MPVKISTKEDLQRELAKIAKETGLDADTTAIADKAWDEWDWRPYGGATSFDEVEEKEAESDYAMRVESENYALRSIVSNITMSEEMSIDEKSAALAKAAEDFKKRMVNIPRYKEEDKTFLGKLRTLLGKGKVHQEPEIVDRSFKVYKDKQGQDRWLTYSSNSFEDLDAELFTTKALEEAIEYADKSGERGPLMFFHIPGTEVGQCDYQGLAGRFLVESGTFDDTPMGQSALTYIKEHQDEQFQVSIGFEYREGDQLDGIFDWLRIRERSFLPDGTAANPWTDFQLIGVKEVDQRHRDALEKVFGKEMADGIISDAEERTKALEAAGVRHKEAEAVTVTDSAVTVVVDAKKDEPVVDPAVSLEDIRNLAVVLADLSTKVEALGTIGAAVEGIRDEMKALKEDYTEKMTSPRFEPTKAARPSESEKNIIDEITQSDLVKQVKSDEQPVNPALAYVFDLIGPPQN